MASSTPLKDIEKHFFVCSVCLDQFKEPKQLPCLHRYCRDCLKKLIKASDDGTIKCPMCTQDYVIPENGVDGFKTDFFMKRMLEFIQLQKSFENKEFKKCIDCSIKTTVTAFCFKCRNFLCDPCSQRHLNNPMFTDHQPHILNLENIEAKNLTLDKFSTLTEDPIRCHIHVKQPAQLCCCTCENKPVCMSCFFGKHKGHDLHDVSEISKSERELLQLKLDELNKHKSKLYELQEKVQATKRKLTDNLSKETNKLSIQYEEQVNPIKATLEENTAEQERQDTDIENRRKCEEDETVIKREEEISIVREKYDKIMKTVIEKYVKESEECKKKQCGIEKQLNSKLSRLECNLKKISTAQKLYANKRGNELQETLDYCEQIIKRYESFTATTSTVLASNDEWTDVQCIPDIRAASEPLIEGMKQDIQRLASLSEFVKIDITRGIIDDVTITEHEESVVDVEGIKDKGWIIEYITSSRDGSIVMTGGVSIEYSHITVINRKGEIQRQDKIKTKTAYKRYCCFVSKFKVATVCGFNEIGIYDIRDGSYNRKIINDATSRWSIDWRVACLATDPVKNNIIICTNNRDVYIFDDQLKYSHNIKLPDAIIGSHDVTVHGRSLLICDDGTDKAYAVTMEGSHSKLMYEFNKPDVDEGHLAWPHRVCTDTNGLIYILWYVHMLDQCVGRILVQYSQDGRQLLTAKSVAQGCCTTLTTDEGEKLLITSYDGKLYTYGLV